MVFCREWGWGQATKKSKILKKGRCSTTFTRLKGFRCDFMVGVRKGCGGFGGGGEIYNL